MNDELQNSLSTLNPAQSQAVFHDEGPLLIVAGAGTGKMGWVLSRRHIILYIKLIIRITLFFLSKFCKMLAGYNLLIANEFPH